MTPRTQLDALAAPAEPRSAPESRRTAREQHRERERKRERSLAWLARRAARERVAVVERRLETLRRERDEVLRRYAARLRTELTEAQRGYRDAQASGDDLRVEEAGAVLYAVQQAFEADLTRETAAAQAPAASA